VPNKIASHPTPTRRTARAPLSRRPARRFSISALALAALAAGCGIKDPPPAKGLYVYCDGKADGLYYVHGRTKNVIDRFSLPCLGPEYVSETGDTGYGEISLSEWTNDTEDIDFLRTLCVAECKSQGGVECEQENGKSWDILNYQEKIVPDPLMKIEAPWRLTCNLPQAKLAPLPWETQVISPDSVPVWPSSGLPIEIACKVFEACAKEFTGPIGMFLYYDDTSVPWGADMGYADHLAITSPGGSVLEFMIGNPDSGLSASSNDIGGRIEYSASDCKENTCPFYLANLALSNTSDTWELYSETLNENVYISNISVQLRRPTLGVWNTESGEFYIGTERVEAYLSGTVQIGDSSAVDMAFLLANPDEIFGKIGEDQTIEILDFIVDDGGDLALEVDLDFDTIAVESLSLSDLSP
jgi:hypothetical protein